jgi:hypothetical protein
VATRAELDAILAHDPSWTPPAGAADAWSRLAASTDEPEALRRERRWWVALAAGRAGDWDEVTRQAEAGLAEPFSDREALRLAFLHCLSGAVEEAEHVVSQAVQLHGDADLARRLADWCQREGLTEAARRLRLGAAGPPGTP